MRRVLLVLLGLMLVASCMPKVQEAAPTAPATTQPAAAPANQQAPVAQPPAMPQPEKKPLDLSENLNDSIADLYYYNGA